MSRSWVKVAPLAIVVVATKAIFVTMALLINVLHTMVLVLAANQICNGFNHMETTCYIITTQNVLAAYLAFHAVPCQFFNWFFDIGATHYITLDLANLATPDKYCDPDNFCIGNGKALLISHISSTSKPLLLLSFLFFKYFYLFNVLLHPLQNPSIYSSIL